MRSPVVWLGGKGNFKSKILPFIKKLPHECFCEPFGGGASVLLAKPKSTVEVYNDLDKGLYEFFTTIQDPKNFSKFYRIVSALPFSRELLESYKDAWEQEPDKVTRVAMWYVIVRQSFGGNFGAGFGTAVTATRRGMPMTNSRWLSTIDLLPKAHDRIKDLIIHNKDGIKCFEEYDSPTTLFYVDPPYVLDTRKSGGYAHELTNEQHKELIDYILTIKGDAIISGYDHVIYDRLSRYGYTKLDYTTISFVAGKTSINNMKGTGTAKDKVKRIESLWIPSKLIG